MGKLKEILKEIFTIRLKRIYFIIGMITLILAEIGRNYYRPFIYQNGINDFGFADSIGNSLGTIAIIFFVFSLVMREGFRKEPYFILALVGFLLLYELAQTLIPGYYFDWNDVKATIGAGMLSYLIYILIKRNEERMNKGDKSNK